MGDDEDVFLRYGEALEEPAGNKRKRVAAEKPYDLRRRVVVDVCVPESVSDIDWRSEALQIDLQVKVDGVLRVLGLDRRLANVVDKWFYGLKMELDELVATWPEDKRKIWWRDDQRDFFRKNVGDPQKILEMLRTLIKLSKRAKNGPESVVKNYELAYSFVKENYKFAQKEGVDNKSKPSEPTQPVKQEGGKPPK